MTLSWRLFTLTNIRGFVGEMANLVIWWDESGQSEFIGELFRAALWYIFSTARYNRHSEGRAWSRVWLLTSLHKRVHLLAVIGHKLVAIIYIFEFMILWCQSFWNNCIYVRWFKARSELLLKKLRWAGRQFLTFFFVIRWDLKLIKMDT